MFIGKVAGCIKTHPDGRKYKVLRLNGKYFEQHRLIYFIETNCWSNIVDHIDGDGLNNIFLNLRNVTIRQNGQNHKSHREGKLVGCSYNKKEKVWRSQIKVNGKVIMLGRFSTELQAHQRYMSELKVRGLL